MRLICTISEKSKENPYAFSYFLKSQNIENSCEPIENEGVLSYRIWIYDEDDVKRATEFYRDYQANPQDHRFHVQPEAIQRLAEQENTPQNPPIDRVEEEEAPKRRRRFFSPAPYGPISIFILLAVIAIFITSQIQRENFIPPKIRGVIQAPVLSKIEKLLVYDYPLYFSLRDHLLTLYTPEQIKEKKPPSEDAKKVLQQIWKTPVWMGFYNKVLLHYKKTDSPEAFDGPLFTKIKQGELWRLVTPIFLHFDLLHIFFNLLWFILLGNQIEYRLGSIRYLILILTTAILSNTAQYLMSGPFFMGLSGVVVGMAAFIFARQQLAPWEGYLLNRFTLVFLAIFVVGMFALQILLFFLQILGKFDYPVGVANTAHLTGALVGYLLGRSRFFAIRVKANR